MVINISIIVDVSLLWRLPEVAYISIVTKMNLEFGVEDLGITLSSPILAISSRNTRIQSLKTSDNKVCFVIFWFFLMLFHIFVLQFWLSITLNKERACMHFSSISKDFVLKDYARYNVNISDCEIYQNVYCFPLNS